MRCDQQSHGSNMQKKKDNIEKAPADPRDFVKVNVYLKISNNLALL